MHLVITHPFHPLCFCVIAMGVITMLIAGDTRRQRTEKNPLHVRPILLVVAFVAVAATMLLTGVNIAQLNR